MRASRFITCTLLAAALGGCSTGSAEQPQAYGIDSRSDDIEQPSTDAMWRTGRGDRVVLRGRVEDVTRLSARPPYDHLLVHLRLPDGRGHIIDLGPEAALTDLQISTGDRLTAEGRMDQSSGRWVLHAERIELDARWHSVPHGF